MIIGCIFQMWERKGRSWTGQQLQGLAHCLLSPFSGFFSTSLCRWATFPQTGFSEKIWLPKAPDSYFTHLCPNPFGHNKLSSATPAAVIEGFFLAGLSHRSTPRLSTVFGGAGCYDWTSLRQGPAPAVTVAKELIRMRLSLQLHGLGSREKEE